MSGKLTCRPLRRSGSVEAPPTARRSSVDPTDQLSSYRPDQIRSVGAPCSSEVEQLEATLSRESMAESSLLALPRVPVSEQKTALVQALSRESMAESSLLSLPRCSERNATLLDAPPALVDAVAGADLHLPGSPNLTGNGGASLTERSNCSEREHTILRRDTLWNRSGSQTRTARSSPPPQGALLMTTGRTHPRATSSAGGRSPFALTSSGGTRSPHATPSISGRVSPRAASERQASGRQASVEFDVSHESAAKPVVKKDRNVVLI